MKCLLFDCYVRYEFNADFVLLRLLMGLCCTCVVSGCLWFKVCRCFEVGVIVEQLGVFCGCLLIWRLFAM